MSNRDLKSRVEELERMVRNLRTDVNIIKSRERIEPRPAILDVHRSGPKSAIDFTITAGRQSEKRDAIR